MRYKKQERFPLLKDSSKILCNKTVAIVGVGGLGSHSAEYVVRMGVGTIILIDDDIVEETNLPRQGMYTQIDSDNSELKVRSTTKQLQKINSDVTIISAEERLTAYNAEELLSQADIVLDGTDNLRARYVINDYCFQNNKPWIYASATASIGMVTSFIPRKTPCFRCVYGNDESEDTASCDNNGVILPALTMAASLQVTEAIKFLIYGECSHEEIRYNIWTREETSVDINIFSEEGCLCQKPTDDREKKEDIESVENTVFLYMLCNGDSVQVRHNKSSFEIEKMLLSEDYVLYRKNKVFSEFRRGQMERVVALPTGKAVFHHVDKERIEYLFYKEL